MRSNLPIFVILTLTFVACGGGDDPQPQQPPAGALGSPNPMTAPAGPGGEPAGTGPQPVFVMAEVVSVDAVARTITVRPSTGATSPAEVPADRSASPGAAEQVTLPVDPTAAERLAALAPGAIVTLTCPPPGGSTSAGSTLAACTSVMSLAEGAGAVGRDR